MTSRMSASFTFEDPESRDGRSWSIPEARRCARGSRTRRMISGRRCETISCVPVPAVAELSTAAEVVPQLVAFIKQREAERGRRLAPVTA